MIQAVIETRKTKVLFMATALALTSVVSVVSVAADKTADLSTEFIHAPKFSEAETLAVRSHFNSVVSATPTTALEAQSTLPTGAERRALPRELMIALPRRDGRFMRLLVSNDVVLLDRLTGIIMDVIPNVTCRRKETPCTRPDA